MMSLVAISLRPPVCDIYRLVCNSKAHSPLGTNAIFQACPKPLCSRHARVWKRMGPLRVLCWPALQTVQCHRHRLGWQRQVNGWFGCRVAACIRAMSGCGSGWVHTLLSRQAVLPWHTADTKHTVNRSSRPPYKCKNCKEAETHHVRISFQVAAS